MEINKYMGVKDTAMVFGKRRYKIGIDIPVGEFGMILREKMINGVKNIERKHMISLKSMILFGLLKGV